MRGPQRGSPPQPAFLPFALPDIGEEEIAEVVDSLRSGWITTGPKTKRFESEFTAFLGDPTLQAVAVNSATAGLHLAVEAIGVRPGDEVITPSLTFTATAEVVRYMGADPVFVDVDPATLCLDPEQVKRRITPRTRAIIPVHYGGMAADMSAILEIARRHRLRVVEDAAHALPSTHGGKLIGTLESDATVFSFYATKPVATGEGGMLVTRDAEIARRGRIMRLHGINHDAFDRYVSTKPAWRYEVVEPGFKYNMTDLAASLGIHQLKKAHAFQGRRAAMADRYDQELRTLPVSLPPHPFSGDLHAWHLYPLRLAEDAPVARDRFIEAMAERGIGCSVHYIPLHQQPYWRDRYRLKNDDFPATTGICERLVSLPIYTRMTDEDQGRVIAAVRSILS